MDEGAYDDGGVESDNDRTDVDHRGENAIGLEHCLELVGRPEKKESASLKNWYQIEWNERRVKVTNLETINRLPSV